MSTAIAAGRRYLPRGYGDLFRQCVIWCGFYFAYQGVRAIVDQNPTKAFANGLRVIDLEQSLTNNLFEQTAQRIADSSHLLLTMSAYTYWNSEFTVLCLTLLWVYLRRHDAFPRFRNTILLANTIGLIGYALVPTAPPWMFTDYGFVDGVNHSSGVVGALANPYAAMPSLHAADALIVGILLSSVVKNRVGKILWLLWPAWVWFCVMATANHFWLDIVGGALVAAFALAVIPRLEQRFQRRPAENLPA
jgi:membrane-associated phospholipid phosphatase